MAEHTVRIDDGDATVADDATLDELEYYQRLLPPREEPFEAGATLLSSLAVVFALSSLWYWPIRLGALAMALALASLAFTTGANRYPRIALSLATICWLLGSVVGVLLDRDVW
jgi:lipopolysaccharide export LptBFGC system permease protein LptF